MRFQWPHAEFVCENRGWLIAVPGLVDVRGRTVAVDLAQKIGGVRFVTPLSQLTSQIQRPLPGRHGLFQPSRAAISIT